MLPTCPPRLPTELREPLLAFASTWAASPLRPRVRPEVAHSWDALLQEWIHTPALPLFVRKDSARGMPPPTHASGRLLIPCDNSPAIWAFTLALEGHCPSLAEVTALVLNSKIPVELTGLGRFGAFYKAGWKLAHVDGVGLRTRTPLKDLPLDMLQEHLRLLLSPSNHFAVPKVWAGLGEIPEVIEVIRTYDTQVRGHAPQPPRSAPQAIAPSEAPGRVSPPRNAVLPVNTYRATRLLFKADVIEALTDDEAFRIETPEGSYEMTRAEFRHTFRNVVASNTYITTRQYSYSTTPAKARRFFVRQAVARR